MKVSVVMPVYNGGAYFEPALQSALAQTYPNIEIVVVNDGSNDGGRTDEIGRRYARLHPGKVRYIEQENRGVGGALNTGIAAMTGDYFAWLSHDDLFEPHKVEVQARVHDLMGRPDALLFSDYALIDADGAVIQEVRLPHALYRRGPRAPLFRAEINGCTVFAPRRLLERAGPFDERLRHTQDYRLWHELLERHEFFHIPQMLTRYRLHPGQDSHKPDMVGEGEALWRAMIDATTEVQRVQMYGSSWRFYDEAHRMLAQSPYPEATRYVADLRDRCIAGALVSVVVTCGDAEAGRRALASVLRQSHANLEVILVGPSVADVRDLAGDDGRVRSAAASAPGLNAARNHGLRLSRGDYVAFLDPPAEFLPEKIERQVRQMARQGAVISCTGCHGAPAADEILTSTVMISRCVAAEGFRFEGEEPWSGLSKRRTVLHLGAPLTIAG